MTRLRPVLLAASLLLSAAVSGPAAAQAFNDTQRQAIEQIVRDYLVKNPEIIVQAIEELQKRERLAEEQKAKTGIADNRRNIFEDPASPVLGNPQGDVTVVEFFDYQCGYCKSVLTDVHRLMKDDPKVRVVFKEFPILGPASLVASRAALASRAQGKYVEFHNALMGHRGQLDEETILRLARSVGLDTDKLKQDMASPAVEQAIGANHALADALGIRGTPAFVVGSQSSSGQLVPGAIKLEEMKRLVSEARKG